MKETHVKFHHLFCCSMLRPAYVTFLKNWLIKLKLHNLRHLQTKCNFHISVNLKKNIFNVKHPVLFCIAVLIAAASFSFTLNVTNYVFQTVSCEIKFAHAHVRAHSHVCDVFAKSSLKRACTICLILSIKHIYFFLLGK